MSMTSHTPQYWLTSQGVLNLTTGMIGFTLVYGIGATICNAVFEWNIFPTYTVCLVESEVQQELDNSVVLAFFVMPSVLLAYTTPIVDLVTVRLMTSLANQSRQIPKGTLQYYNFEQSRMKKKFISDCRDIPFRATLISAFLWIFIFILGLSFSISTIEVSATYKAMAPYICAAATILLRHPCVSAFAFRANEECRRLDMDEEREKRRKSVIEEAKKARDLRKSKAGIQDEEDRIERVTETSV